MSKHTNQRESMGDAPSAKSRPNMQRQRQMEDTYYVEKYGKTHKLMWILDDRGQVDKWLNAGAEPVEAKEERQGKFFEGLSDRNPSKYKRVVGGVDEGGNTLYQYLLMMPHADYAAVKTDPLKQRQAEIRKAMGLGATPGELMEQSPEARAVNNTKLQTYAANNIDGTTGFNQIQGS